MAQITLGGNPCNTNGSLPETGAQMPDFKGISADLKPISSSDFNGKKVIYNIFPSVDTGVCAASVREFNKHAASLENTVVVCASMDLPFAQARFCGAEGIENVVMMSGFQDGGKFGDALGVKISDGGFAGLYARSIIVTDESGKVTYTELVPEVGQDPNFKDALAAVQ